MRGWVSEWQQEGRIFMWRYANPRPDWDGWQFTGDLSGCQSLRNLLDRMRGGSACHRTLTLSTVSNAILGVPNAGYQVNEQYSKLRIQFTPEASSLLIRPKDGKLILTLGNDQVRSLTSAIAHVETDEGDFGIEAEDEKGLTSLMFWWTPD